MKRGKFQQSSVSPTVQLGRGSFQEENTVVVTENSSDVKVNGIVYSQKSVVLKEESTLERIWVNP